MAAGHTGNQLGSLAAQDESSQIKEHTHHRQQDKHIDLEMEGDGGHGRRKGRWVTVVGWLLASDTACVDIFCGTDFLNSWTKLK